MVARYSTFELMDTIEILSDSKSCLVYFLVWCHDLRESLKVCCSYDLASHTLTYQPDDSDNAPPIPGSLVDSVIHCGPCLDDAKEIVMYTKDQSREKN